MSSRIDPTMEPAASRSPTANDTLDSVTALARFEFEPNKGNDGTKIMMVEWQDDNKSRHKSGSWQVSWQGKKTTFAAEDNPSDSTNRLYFLLPPGATIPPTIIITYTPPNPQSPTKGKTAQRSELYKTSTRIAEEKDVRSLHMTVNPLPAIFTPELGATAKASGKKGVLHTIWAKRRLQVLAREIQSESKFNLEGIALEMALAEKQWIEQNFGVATPQPKPHSTGSLKLDLATVNSAVDSLALSPGVQSPRSPGGRRLTDKLKGLSLVTGDNQFNSNVNTPIRDFNPLSPEVGDIAVSSFNVIRGERHSRQNQTATNTASRKVVPLTPPSQVTDQQAASASASLASIARGDASKNAQIAHKSNKPNSQDGEDLFAVAMSPRSPDAPKSPFSLPSGEEETGGSRGAFSRIKGVQV